MAHLFWLSDQAWAAIEPHLPHGQPGKPRVDDRRVISGILHVLKTGCRWRDVPAAYGPPTTVYNRFNRWSRRGVWQRMFERMAAAGPVPEALSLDSTHVKAHRSAQGSEGLGRKRSGSRGAARPARSMAWPMRHRPAGRLRPDAGQHPGHPHGHPAPGGTASAQAHDRRQGLTHAMSLRRWLKRRKIRAVIPSLATRTFPFPLDRKACKRRRVIERMWERLKNGRRIATRYDRLARNDRAGLAPVSLIIAWT